MPRAAISQEDGQAAVVAEAGLPQAPQPQTPAGSQQNPPAQPQTPATAQLGQNQNQAAGESTTKPKPPPQTKRILGLMPNYRAVSAGEQPPPPTPRQAFKIATLNSFDYSSGVFVGITSLLAEASNDHPQLGKGPAGFWRYYWRGFVDKTDGNYWVIWALPSVTHEDSRYYSMGTGSVWDRGVYAASRVLITRDYHGKNTFNLSEVLGRGIASAISLSYYPSKTQTVGGFSEKYAYSLGRDALTNAFREFWPDINAHLIHRHHGSSS